jgi:hypothetical protein
MAYDIYAYASPANRLVAAGIVEGDDRTPLAYLPEFASAFECDLDSFTFGHWHYAVRSA